MAEQEARHYIGLLGAGLKMSVRYEGRFTDGPLVDPNAPIEVGRFRTPPDDSGPLLYPVSAEVAREWTGDDELPDDDGLDEDDVP